VASLRSAFALAFAIAPLALFVTSDARGANGPILHEPIAPDPHEDIALSVALDGDLPAAIDTPNGVVTAPDPRAPITPRDAAPYAPGGDLDAAPDAPFRPDRDTRRPDVLPYDDPFSPSTAPFKRLVAYDAVDENFNLKVRDTSTHLVSTHATPKHDGSESEFFADMIVELAPGRRVRIPSVGPGTKIAHARAGVGSTDIPITIVHDGADNWFVQSKTSARARLVMELTIPRAALGGDFADRAWQDLPATVPLPPNVQAAALEVAAKIGVSRDLSPRENVRKLVAYFRDFVNTDEPLPPSADVYRDLALSKKGVCRHRAFAFTVTALALGIPTRMVLNEAHAWVEVHDGVLWKRVDLGGAGRELHDDQSPKVAYEPPPDPFAWPPGSTRGAEMPGSAESKSPGPPGSSSANGSGSPFVDAPASSSSLLGQSSSQSSTRDERPASRIALVVSGHDARRGAAFDVRGDVRAGRDACAHVMVNIALRELRTKREAPIGSLAADDAGHFEGARRLRFGRAHRRRFALRPR
jgi:hypothetical protein